MQFDGRPQLAHRVAWFLARGAWPEGEVRQRCGNRLCVRPEHLVSDGLTASPIPAPKPTPRRARGTGNIQVRGNKIRIRTSARDPVTGRRVQPSFTVEAGSAQGERYLGAAAGASRRPPGAGAGL